MRSSQLGLGIVGTGMIAGMIADAIPKSKHARLIAVAGRSIDSARSFVAKRQGIVAVQDLDGLLTRTDVNAIYVATPTSAKEDIALAAIAAGKHVLVEKPFTSRASVLRMTQAASTKNVAFMDATNFVHHPRTAFIKESIPERIGSPRSLHTVFYFPFSDRNNIRFNVKLEPMGALGDMAWYSMRSVVEYLRPHGPIAKVAVTADLDPASGSVVRAMGLVAFEGGEASTFDIGYTAGTFLMDLQLLGTSGVISMDDFVLDWTDTWAFQNPDIKAGYAYRTKMATRKDVTFVPTPSTMPAEVAMIETFAELTDSGKSDQRVAFATASLKTQEYLDALWAAIPS